MHSQQISEEEWQEVIDIFYDIEDALEDNDDKLYAEALFDLNCQLDKLEQTYGELAIIVSTRAEYLEDTEQQIRLFQHAVTLSEQQQDPVALVQSLEAICDLLLETEDIANCTQWFEKLQRAVEQYGDEYLCNPIEEYRDMLYPG